MRTHRRWRPFVLALVVSLVPAGPVAAAPGEDPQGPGEAGASGTVPTAVEMDGAGVGGLDVLEVSVTDRGSPRACLTAERTEIRTEIRDGEEVEVKAVYRETGCQSGIDHHFDLGTWEAPASGSISTTLRTRTYERGHDGGWELVGTTDAPSSAQIDLVWRSRDDDPTNDPRATWDIQNCAIFPPICALWVSAAMVREATVEGTLELGAAEETVVLPPDQAGAMGWWKKVECSRFLVIYLCTVE